MSNKKYIIEIDQADIAVFEEILKTAPLGMIQRLKLATSSGDQDRIDYISHLSEEMAELQHSISMQLINNENEVIIIKLLRTTVDQDVCEDYFFSEEKAAEFAEFMGGVYDVDRIKTFVGSDLYNKVNDNVIDDYK